MLYNDLKVYLLVSAAEGCSPAERAYRRAVLIEFIRQVGDIAAAQLRKDHLNSYILHKMAEAKLGPRTNADVIRARFAVEHFLLWLHSQPRRSALEPARQN